MIDISQSYLSMNFKKKEMGKNLNRLHNHMTRFYSNP
jgi:hypothetical protein